MNEEYEPIKIVVSKTGRYADPKTEWAELAGQEAHCAIEFVQKWGMVACVPDGEDGAGRQKLRLATPDEVVARAVTTTELLYRTMRERRWIDTNPMLLVPAEVDEKAG